MKNTFLLLLLFTGIVKGQIVTIPDANFKAKLLSASANNNVAKDSMGNAIAIDGNANGEIEVSEATLVASLSIFSSGIASVSGLESFANLKTLICFGNQLSSLDVSMLSQLVTLRCNNNTLTTLVLSPSVADLNCSYNQLTSLNLNGNEYTNLSIAYNQIASISLPPCNIGNAALDISGNLYTTIDFSNVMFSAHPEARFTCENTQLIALDFSHLYGFGSYHIRSNPNLNTINFKNGMPEICFSLAIDPACADFLDIANNPILQHVCVDEDLAGFSEVTYFTDTTTIDNTSVISTYCSFVPGGNFNTITGTTLYDLNNNGCDVNDPSQPYIKMKITSTNASGATVTNAEGIYSFFTDAGTFTVQPELEHPEYFSVSPPSVPVIFQANDNSVSNTSFCITANGVHPDLAVVLDPISTARAGFDATYKIIVTNNGTTYLSESLILNYDSYRTTFTTATPAVTLQDTNNLIWDFTELAPFETRAFYFTLHLNSTTDIPALNVGDILNFNALCLPVGGDENMANNTFEFHQNVVNEEAPNFKTCLEGETIAVDNIGSFLHYNIDFDNIGTTDANNIVVRDALDTSKYEVNSMQLLYDSHPVEVKVTGNVVEFIFKNINLPSAISNPIGGHGNVLFKVKTLPTLQVGDIVTNTATLFFDYNAPITTNEARTNISTLTAAGFIKDPSVVVYPNPTKNIVTISAKNNLKSVSLFDVQGRLLQTAHESKKTTTLDLSNRSNGNYFLKITTEKGSTVEKVIKE